MQSKIVWNLTKMEFCDKMKKVNKMKEVLLWELVQVVIVEKEVQVEVEVQQEEVQILQ